MSDTNNQQTLSDILAAPQNGEDANRMAIAIRNEVERQKAEYFAQQQQEKNLAFIQNGVQHAMEVEQKADAFEQQVHGEHFEEIPAAEVPQPTVGPAMPDPMELVGEGEMVDLTPEEEKMVEEMLEDKTGDPEDDALMEQAKKETEEHFGEPGYMTTATVETNAETGQTKVVTIDDENSGMQPITETFDEYMERHANDQSIEDLPIEEDTAAKVITEQHPDISFDDAQQLASILKRWKDKEISTIQAFNEFPDFMTAGFNAQMMRAGVPFKDQVNHKREFAKAVLEDLSTSTQMRQATDDVDAQINQIYKQYGGDVNVLYQAGLFEKINAMRAKAKAVADVQYETSEVPEGMGKEEWEAKQAEKVLRIEEVAESLEESFKFTKFAKRIGHIKAKKIDLTDPKRCFSHFNSKYARSQFSAAEVGSIVPIIERHCGFTHEQAIEFTVVFCEYCKNMRPTNVAEHVFMYYTISNINSLLFNAGDKAEQFANGLVGNIKKLMEIREAKSDGSDYVPYEPTDEEIDELIKRSAELVKEAEEAEANAQNEQEATPSEEKSSSTHETNEEASAGVQELSEVSEESNDG